MIIIDPPQVQAHGRMWSHLASDTSQDELHTFARRIGVPERGFDGDQVRGRVIDDENLRPADHRVRVDVL